jgi:[ribosomal protein S5]-alanine N-acetyltransferase
MNTLLIQSEQLFIRRFNAATDTDFIIALLNSAGWLEYIGDRNVHDTAAAQSYIQRLHNFEQQFGYTFFAVGLRATEQLIGMSGFIKRDYLDFPDLGFAFLPAFEGKGFAHEAAQLTLQYGYNTLNLTTVTAITTLDNERSANLLLRLGFEKQKTFTEENETLLLWTLYC